MINFYEPSALLTDVGRIVRVFEILLPQRRTVIMFKISSYHLKHFNDTMNDTVKAYSSSKTSLIQFRFGMSSGPGGILKKMKKINSYCNE